ncbi:MAG: acetyl-CoA carboxylase, biotin carboxyl carrier protein [Oscillospiraceae bacterium]|nr:acetyl-CoA carboxylase, biotin carboxyl carrier protein [Oscillospiraceae bacterium]
MDSNEIRELAAIMKDMGLSSLSYQNGSETIKLKRSIGTSPVATLISAEDFQSESPVEDTVVAGIFTVKSPMVGVFYSAPAPDMEPYVAIGDTVHAGDVLCIIETMKIMNEITAERDGVINEICVENKDVVEFGQPLFRIGNA